MSHDSYKPRGFPALADIPRQRTSRRSTHPADANPYDLSSGEKGFPALARSERKEQLRMDVQIYGANAAMHDPMSAEGEQYREMEKDARRKLEALELEDRL